MIKTSKLIRAKGFTLIELLIVVIILAILAAIVIPQFANTTNDAREGALDANLNTLRSALEVYKIQHKNIYPGVNPGTGNGTVPTCTGTAGVGALGAAAFAEQMSMPSDVNGNTCSVADANFNYGPYLRGGVPPEPINNKGTVAFTAGTGAPITVAASVTTGGWLFDPKSGQIVMNSGVLDSKGKAYSAH